MFSRLNTIFLALGGFVAVAVPITARAQSGDALAHAEQACLDNGVGPGAITFDTCVDRVATDFDQGAPAIASIEARQIADAQQACLAYGIEPLTLGYRQCVDDQTGPTQNAVVYVR